MASIFDFVAVFLLANESNASDSGGSSFEFDLNKLYQDFLSYLETQAVNLVDWFGKNAPDIVGGILVILIGHRVAKIAVRYSGRPVYRWVARPSIARTILRSIRYLILAISILFAARLAFGISLTSFVLTATVFSAVLGIILAPLVGDIINGIFVLSDQPYEVGDMVEIVDTQQKGFVDDVTIRYTKIFTLDNTFLVIPNSQIRKRDINNYSAEDVRTRQTLDVSITYESDVELARELVDEAARQTPEVISTKGNIRIGNADYPMDPTVFIKDFGDHGLHLRLRYWLREPYHLQRVKSKVNERIWTKFQQNDIKVPYPHRHHIFDDTSGAAKLDIVETEDGAALVDSDDEIGSDFEDGESSGS